MRCSAQLLLDSGNRLHVELEKRNKGPQKDLYKAESFLDDMVELSSYLEPDSVMKEQRLILDRYSKFRSPG